MFHLNEYAVIFSDCHQSSSATNRAWNLNIYEPPRPLTRPIIDIRFLLL